MNNNKFILTLLGRIDIFIHWPKFYRSANLFFYKTPHFKQNRSINLEIVAVPYYDRYNCVYFSLFAEY